MKTYWNLFDKIIDINNIRLAHMNARKDKTFYWAVKNVDENMDVMLKQIQEMLREGRYEIKSSDYTTEKILDKGKERELWKLPYYPHRIVQWAIMLQLEPIFMKVFCNHTCASLKGRWIHYAYNLTKKYMRNEIKCKYCLKIDIKKFYPSINHKVLKELLRRKIRCERTLKLLDQIIDSYPWEKGIPIGSYLSQYLANYYLAYFDHWIKEEKWCKYIVRYMDDIVVFWENKEKLHKLLYEMREYLEKIGLEIKDNWQIFPSRIRGVDFVGYRFFGKYILLRKRTCNRMKRKLLWIRINKVDKNQLLNYGEWCCCNSYVGWMIYCNHFRIYEKYIQPIIKWLTRYYYYIIKRNRDRLDKYYRKLIGKKFIFV